MDNQVPSETLSECCESRETLSAIMDNLDTLIYVSDPEKYEILYFNDKARELLGNPQSKTCHAYVYGRSEPCTFCQTEGFLEKNESPHMSEREQAGNLHLAGQLFSFRRKVIQWTNGKKVRLTIAQNITEHVHISNKLRETTERFRALSASASRMIALETNEEIIAYAAGAISILARNSLVFMVRPTEDHSGFRVVHAEGRTPDLLPQLHSIAGVDILKLEFNVPGRIEFLLSGDSFLEYVPGLTALLDRKFPRRTTANILRFLAGEVVYGVGVYAAQKLLIGALVISPVRIDTSDTLPLQTLLYQSSVALQRKSFELELREEKKRAEEASEAKSRFLAMVSHEIRTPLNAVMGMLDFTLQTEVTGEQRDYLTTARDSSHHLVQVINDVLDFSKIEADEIELEFRSFDIHHLIRNAWRTYLANASTKGIEILVENDDSLYNYYTGDEVRIRQVLFNLVSNAIKFTNEGSVRIHGREENEFVVIEVQDSGIGIPVEKQGLIFESFKQSDLSHTREYGGTGLGLSISQKLANMMGGRIDLKSEVDKGSSFTLILPLNRATPPSHEVLGKNEKKEFSFSQTLSFEVLIVEDNPINQKIARLALEKAGNSVEVAENGRVAIDMLKEKDYELVVMDAEMPVLDGLEATRLIRAGEAGERNETIPIIGLSAHALGEFKALALSAGMDDYITKPIDISRLQSKLEEVYLKRFAF